MVAFQKISPELNVSVISVLDFFHPLLTYVSIYDALVFS